MLFFQGREKIILIILFLIPTVVWLNNTGNPLLYLTKHVPIGQGFYVWSKLFGLYAVILFWLQATIGLLKNTKYQPQWISPAIHKWLGITLLLIIIFHVSSFITATTLRSGHLTSHLLLPNTEDYYHARITLGLLSFSLVVVTLLARKITTKNIRINLHRLSLPAFYLSAWHSLAIGTESREPILIILYVFMLSSISSLIAIKIMSYLTTRRKVVA